MIEPPMAVRATTCLPAALLALCLPSAAHDPFVVLPPQFELLDIPGALTSPTDLVGAPGGFLFVAEKPGRVRVFLPGSNPLFPELQPGSVIDLTDEINKNGDRGLLGIALQPDFLPDGGASSWIYLLYTATPVFGEDPFYDADQQYSHSMLTRYRLITDAGGAIVADLGSRQVLLGERLPDGRAPDGMASLHNSHSTGTLLFAPDGSLLIATGDGAHWDTTDTGGIDAPGFDDFVHPTTGLRGQLDLAQDSGAFRSRDPRSLAGKVLRVDPDTGFGLASNPYFDGDPTSNASRVWATGLRNPFRMTHRPGTGSSQTEAGDVGQLLVGDVGWTQYEELNLVDAPGLDFGWPCFEGFVDVESFASFSRDADNPWGWPDCADAAPGPVRAPLLAVHHDTPELTMPGDLHQTADGSPTDPFVGACVIGGTFYQGGSYPAEYADRYFFADYADGWIKTARIDAGGQLLDVRDFGAGLERPTTLTLDPLNGDVLICDLGTGAATGHLIRLRHGQNLSPEAALAASTTEGGAPLTVSFDASASSDPELQPLTYRFDFGDGTPPLESDTPAVEHTYTISGVYQASVEVTDSAALGDMASLEITVGLEKPSVWIDTPTTGSQVAVGSLVALSGGGQTPDGGPVDLTWIVDLYHDEHVHPDFFSHTDVATTQSSVQLPIEAHGSPEEVDYLHITLVASSPTGTQASTAIWAYPEGQTSDPAAKALPIARVFELDPPEPQGNGNKDIEVVRDGLLPASDGAASVQFDTFHVGEQGDDDWIGFDFGGAPQGAARLIALEFQEGLHFPGGGWFDDLWVEVRAGGSWTEVSGLVIDPPYPAEPGSTPSFESYVLHFDPTWGDAVRLRGVPGGAAKFVSVGELRVRMIDPLAGAIGQEDLSHQGQIISRLDELSPPLPLGPGNKDPETIRNGTMPAPGTQSLWAQIATFHNGDQGDLDWVGYDFDHSRTIEQVLFQEGQPASDGGWFETLGLEVREVAGGPWVPLPDVSPTPLYRNFGPASQSYETYVFDLAPRVVDAVRVAGVPGGSSKYVTIAELVVRGPQWDPELCGFQPFGADPSNPIELASHTPPLVGYPIRIEFGQAPPNGAGLLMVAMAPAALPLGGGTLLVDPATALFLPIVADTSGAGRFDFALPPMQVLAGLGLYLQVGCFDAGAAGQPILSNGLELVVCPD